MVLGEPRRTIRAPRRNRTQGPPRLLRVDASHGDRAWVVPFLALFHLKGRLWQRGPRRRGAHALRCGDDVGAAGPAQLGIVEAWGVPPSAPPAAHVANGVRNARPHRDPARRRPVRPVGTVRAIGCRPAISPWSAWLRAGGVRRGDAERDADVVGGSSRCGICDDRSARGRGRAAQREARLLDRCRVDGARVGGCHRSPRSPSRRDQGHQQLVARIDAVLPQGEPVRAMGADETLLGIVSFVTGRRVIQIETKDLSEGSFVLVQSVGSQPPPQELASAYERVEGREFGPRRRMALWRRR